MRINYRSLEYRHFLILLLVLVFSSCSSTDSFRDADQGDNTYVDDSGMWLPSQLTGSLLTDMKDRGLKIDASTIYNPNAPSLAQAVVRININKNLAGTGSFVSPRGLILTSHSIALRAISAASKGNHNYIEEGFYASKLGKEIPLADYEVYIPIEQREVTGQINQQLGDSLTYRQRYIASQKIRQQIIANRKANNPNLVVEINDFWGGNRQFMSVYKVLRDVRLVHAPPESLVSADNNEWPRHSADYTFLRAYVSPNGTSQSYHQANVPFAPSKHLDIKTRKITSHDFTMVMGFPGETSRHLSSYALEFYHRDRNPIVIDSYQAIFDGLEYAADQDPQYALQTFAQRQSLSKTIDYYQGLQQGVKNQQIIEQKKTLEQGFEKWFKKDSLRNSRYRRVLKQLDQAYRIASQTGDLLHATVYTINNTKLFQVAALYDAYRNQLDDASQQSIPQQYKDSLLTRHQNLLNNIHLRAQQVTLSKMLQMLATLPDGKVIFHILELFGGAEAEELNKKIDDYLQTQRQQSIVYNPDEARDFLSLPLDSARQQSVDPFVELYRALMENYQFSKKNYVQHIAYQKPAHERYIQGMMEYKPDLYPYPDANGTLRISVGRVNGFHPDDSLSQAPITTLARVKSNAEQFGFSSRKNRNLPVNFLTTNDVTGGNAGSPILNGKGQLIGITFDSATKGVAGDYQYDPNQSRTMSTSAEYILFLMNKFRTNRLINEIRSK